jgi:transposase-like protein
VIIEEIKKKIGSRNLDVTKVLFRYPQNTISHNVFDIGEKCPRCGSFGFSLDLKDRILWPELDNFNTANSIANLYKCNSCNLELTEKEYNIAKREKLI